jgi:E3 ubiquitin-protein ligase UBR4
LGKWFADTLFPPDEETASATKDTSGDELKSNNKRDGSDASVSLLVPQKGEPAGFVSLASHVFIFLNKHIVNCESKFVRNYIRAGLTEQQVCIILKRHLTKC